MSENVAIASEETTGTSVHDTIHRYFIWIFIAITLIMIIIRILTYFMDLGEYVMETKDIDYKILMEGMDNGLINFYDPITISEYPPYYLYFWYFMFYPMYLIPIEIGVYVWDALRLVSCVLVARKAPKMFKNTTNLIIFFILCSLSYGLDAYFNNVNFVVLFLLFYSYVFWLGEVNHSKWVAGVLFMLATFKINSLLYLPVLIIIKQIKLKDLVYFIVPLGLICIPYALFPDYFIQMVNNWTYGSEEVQSSSMIISVIMTMDSVIWKALQPSHMMFIGLILIIFLENIKDEKWKGRWRILLLSILGIYNLRLLIVLFFFPVLLS